MKEHPILFSAPMVRALLDGTKTQTRRIVKRQPQHESTPMAYLRPEGLYKWVLDTGMGDGTTSDSFSCPYGQPGDRLWVRETFQQCPECGRLNYKSSSPTNCHGCDMHLGRWYPSIHIQRIWSRITLEIISVRVERLQDISEVDAKAEGCNQIGIETGQVLESGTPIVIGSYAADYCDLWESINGKGSWDANPWVWVIEFKRL